MLNWLASVCRKSTYIALTVLLTLWAWWVEPVLDNRPVRNSRCLITMSEIPSLLWQRAGGCCACPKPWNAGDLPAGLNWAAPVSPLVSPLPAGVTSAPELRDPPVEREPKPLAWLSGFQYSLYRDIHSLVVTPSPCQEASKSRTNSTRTHSCEIWSNIGHLPGEHYEHKAFALPSHSSKAP